MQHATCRGALILAMLLCAPLSVSAQGGGGGGGGPESGHGGEFGDLIHIKRSPLTGQPILQKRWIELPGDTFGWGYCPIPVDAGGVEIPFAELSCDVDPTQLDRVVEVDYFGRLSGGRTRERNIRMHFDEAIENIKDADLIELEPAGRIKMGRDCTPEGICSSWKIIDSPLENMAFYQRLLKYGHIQTDPMEVDIDFHGDPATGVVYHPALGPEDWAKFRGILASMLPRATPEECFTGDVFDPACAAPQDLTAVDFVRAASFLGGAADKHGKTTVDLVQYLNRIIKITKTTEYAAATLNTLPTLIRTCPEDALVCTDDNGVISDGDDTLPAPANELFMDFTPASYLRDDHFTMTYPGLKLGTTVGTWVEDPALSVFDFLVFINGPSGASENINAFVQNTSDAQRAVEFVHNYELPVNMYAMPTTTTVLPAVVPFSAADRTVTLTANITNGTTVNGGTVIFIVETSAGTEVGLTVLSGTVVAGAASAAYVVPGGTVEQTLVVRANYSGAPGFTASSGSGTLTIVPVGPPQISVADASTIEGTGTASSLTFELTLSAPSDSTITVQYATADYTAVAPGDYEATSGTATFDPLVTRVLVTVPVVSDIEDELDEALTLVLSGVVNATLATSVANGTIVDDDGSVAPAVALDFNQDGSADLLWQNSASGRIGLWYMKGTAVTEYRIVEPGQADPDWEIRAAGDFNGDRKPDVIWQHQRTGEIAAWLLDGHRVTGFTRMGSEAVLDWTIVGAADMDRDGQLDLVWQNEATGALRIWHMIGTTHVDTTAIALGVGGTDWHVVGVADMNGDGSNDLVWRNFTLGGVATWLMDDGEVLSTRWLTPSAAQPAWQVVGVRDVNGDGQADLVWQNETDGRLFAWIMNGLTAVAYEAIAPDVDRGPTWKVVGVR